MSADPLVETGEECGLVGVVVGRAADEDVVAVAGVEHTRESGCDKQVVAGAAPQYTVAVASVAAVAGEDVIARATVDVLDAGHAARQPRCRAQRQVNHDAARS